MGFFKRVFRPVTRAVKKTVKTVIRKPINSLMKAMFPELPELPDLPKGPEPPDPNAAAKEAAAFAKTQAGKKGRASTVLAGKTGPGTDIEDDEQIRRKKLGGYSAPTG